MTTFIELESKNSLIWVDTYSLRIYESLQEGYYPKLDTNNNMHVTTFIELESKNSLIWVEVMFV